MATRRNFIASSLAVASALRAVSSDAQTGGKARRMRRIACEEGFTIPEIGAAQRRVLGARAAEEPGEAAIFGVNAPPASTPAPGWLAQLPDIGAGRIAEMDDAGVAMQLLLLSSPGVQLFDAAEARDLSVLANDRLAAAVKAHPDRFAGLAAIPPQDPAFAARELERSVRNLGLNGAVINSHTHGEYLDEVKFRPILEAAADLRTPLYIHPRAPSPQTVRPYLDHGLVGAIWGYAVETSLHSLRLIFSGVFDELPNLRIVIGHMGEGIPFFLDRLDTHYAYGGGRGPKSKPLRRKPSEIFKDHFVITTSGMNFAAPLKLALDALGPQRVLFAADYPFENQKLAVEQMDAALQEHPALADVYYRNAQRVFGISPSPAAPVDKAN